MAVCVKKCAYVFIAFFVCILVDINLDAKQIVNTSISGITELVAKRGDADSAKFVIELLLYAGSYNPQLNKLASLTKDKLMKLAKTKRFTPKGVGVLRARLEDENLAEINQSLSGAGLTDLEVNRKTALAKAAINEVLELCSK